MFKIDSAHFKNAKALGVEIKPSKNKGKKLDVFRGDDKIATIGDLKYNDYRSYIKSDGLQYANERKRLYKIRHGSDMNKVGTPSFYANKILWT